MVETLTAWIESMMTTSWIYPLVGTLVFLDSLIPAFPSEVPLNLTGAWAGSRGVPDLTTMFVVACAAAIFGDNLCYFLGTRLMRFVRRVRPGTRAYESLRWVKRNMRRGGGAAIIIARFIPSGRFFMTILLGSVRYPWPAFALFDAIGVVIWAGQALGVGYIGGLAFSDNPLIGMIVGIIGAILLGLGIQWLQNRALDWWDTRRGLAQTP